MNVHGTRADGVWTAVVLLAVSLFLIRLPLFDYLGYEFSAAIALVLPWLVGFNTIRILGRSFPRHAEVDPRSYREKVLQIFRDAMLFLAIPLAVGTLNVIFVKNCSYFEGFGFFILIPCVTCVFSITLGCCCFVLTRRSLLTYSALLILLLLYPLYVGYESPQIYSYDPIYGYFPGFSYDEVLTISSTLVLFRGLTLVLSVLLIMVSMIVVERTSIHDSLLPKLSSFRSKVRVDARTMTVLFLLLILAGAFVFRNRLGFETSTASLQRELSACFSTEHFHIFYTPASFSEEQLEWIGTEHEFRFHQVEKALHTQFSGTIDSYIYPDADAKRRLIGTGTTNIAKPWRREIHLNKEMWESTLKHELVHVLAGEFGMPLIKAHYNIGLVEGLATAIDDDVGNHTVHEYAAAILNYGVITNPGRLISPTGFMFQSSSVSYVLMGSFCTYLIERYGMVRFKQLYGGKSSRYVFGESYDKLVESWQHFLLRVRARPEWRNHVEFYFKRPSIFAKECARAVAKLNQEGYRFLAQHNAAMAMTTFAKSLQKSWNTNAFSGLVRSAYQAGRFDTVIALMNSQVNNSTHIVGVSNLLLAYGDALWHRAEIDSARSAYEEALSFDFSDSYNEAATLRLVGIDDARLRSVLPDYFVGTLTDSVALQIFEQDRQYPSHPFLSYLLAKVLMHQKRYSEAVHELETIHGQFGNTVLDAGREQLLAQSYFNLKKYQLARMHFWQSLNFVTSRAAVQRVDEWLDRCEWYEANAKLKIQK